MVIAVLLFRPEGLLPRPARRYFPGGGHEMPRLAKRAEAGLTKLSVA